jgi:phosphatidylglycerophosphate synthase
MSTQSIPIKSAIAPAFKSALRINQSLTAGVEKKALEWMAHRLPGWVTSDQLTLLGFTAQIAAGVAYAASHVNRYWLLAAVLGIALNWFGDSMDGTLARVRRQPRPRFGFYADHMVDLFGSIALMTGLGFSGFLHWPVAIAMLVAFLLLSAESYLATYTLGQFQLSQGIFGPTEIRLLLIAGNLALLHSPWSHLFGYRVLLFDLGGIIAATCMFAQAITLTTRHTAQLYREEPIP